MIDINELKESGVLLVDKPVDWTSHDVVNFLRKRFAIRKAGHCGTLDPAATGLLVLVLGKATRLSDKLSGQNKTYAGTMRLGIETFSQDRDGEVTATATTDHLTPEEIRNVCLRYIGEIQQVPPMVSAIKKDGQPLYKMARKGKVIERDPRPVVIYELKLGRIAIPEVDFEVTCSKGTYVRTLCADIGAALGVGAHLLQLRRLRSGKFNLDQGYPIETIKQWDRAELMNRIIPLIRLPEFL